MQKIFIALFCCVALLGCESKSDIELLQEEIEMLKLEKEKKALETQVLEVQSIYNGNNDNTQTDIPKKQVNQSIDELTDFNVESFFKEYIAGRVYVSENEWDWEVLKFGYSEELQICFGDNILHTLMFTSISKNGKIVEYEEIEKGTIIKLNIDYKEKKIQDLKGTSYKLHMYIDEAGIPQA